MAIHQSDEVLAAMDEWNQHHHGVSGLIDRVRTSGVDEQDAERITLDFLGRYIEPRRSPMCGNSFRQNTHTLFGAMASAAKAWRRSGSSWQRARRPFTYRESALSRSEGHLLCIGVRDFKCKPENHDGRMPAHLADVRVVEVVLGFGQKAH